MGDDGIDARPVSARQAWKRRRMPGLVTPAMMWRKLSWMMKCEETEMGSRGSRDAGGRVGVSRRDPAGRHGEGSRGGITSCRPSVQGEGRSFLGVHVTKLAWLLPQRVTAHIIQDTSSSQWEYIPSPSIYIQRSRKWPRRKPAPASHRHGHGRLFKTPDANQCNAETLASSSPRAGPGESTLLFRCRQEGRRRMRAAAGRRLFNTALCVTRAGERGQGETLL
jgi:hypothetical protein